MTSCLMSSTNVELRVDGARDALEEPNRGVLVMGVPLIDVLLISMLSVNLGGAFSVNCGADWGTGWGVPPFLFALK